MTSKQKIIHEFPPPPLGLVHYNVRHMQNLGMEGAGGGTAVRQLPLFHFPIWN